MKLLFVNFTYVYNDHHGLFDFQAFEVSDVFLVFQVLIVYVSLICHAFQV